jgi:calpain-15
MADELAQKLSELLAQPLERCQEALTRCKNDEEAATDYLLTNEHQPESFWEPQGSKPVVIEFQRWGENLAKVDEETLSEIIARSLETGEPFTDASFPPSDASLFFDPVSARNSWKCHDCNRENPLPSEAVMESLRRRNPTAEQVREFFQYIANTNPVLAISLQQNPVAASRLLAQSFGAGVGQEEPLVCKFCQGQFPLGLIDSRPSQWLRPPNIRDDVTVQYGAGAPWKLIRDSVRPDDVRQGAVGNCWFVGALTILARQKPYLYEKLFPFNQEYNEAGAYLVRLCKDGLWRNVIVDDNLPCNRNKSLCYTTASRRQLWVPLIEKAAAKLSGCYEGMHSGTLCEAFSLLTGFATQRELLPSDMNPEEKELLWARVVSAHAAGCLVGLACAMKPQGKSISLSELHEKGLQAPHAYVLLDTRELTVDGGVKLVQLGNPWGDRSPSTWKGAWSNGSTEFRKAVQGKLLPSSSNDINPNGEFWMTWEDVLAHFATVEICRTQDNDLSHDERVQGWLPALTGLGDMFIIQTRASHNGKVRVDISLYQESNMVRESAKGVASTNVDLGFVVLDSSHRLVGYHQRRNLPEVSEEFFLGQNSRYHVIPISFENCLLPEHRKMTLALRTTDMQSVGPLSKAPMTPEILRAALIRYAGSLGFEESRILPGVTINTAKDGCGIVLTCTNQTTCVCAEVIVDAEESSGLNSSRGTLFSTDIVPPARTVVLAILTPRKGSNHYRMGVSFAAAIRPPSSRESHVPPVDEPDSPPIHKIHASEATPRENLIWIEELLRRNSDPKLFGYLVNLSMERAKTATRLKNEYLSAGIGELEATQIANEEAEFMYL